MMRGDSEGSRMDCVGGAIGGSKGDEGAMNALYCVRPLIPGGTSKAKGPYLCVCLYSNQDRRMHHEI